MKKHLLLCFASLAASVMFAQALPKRATGLPLKQVSHAEHFVRPSFAAPQLAPRSAEAPATFYEVPFVHSLGKGEPDVIAGYVAFDSNADTKTWKVGGFTGYSVCMKPASGSMDDWMISPAVHLVPGKTYELSVQMSSVLSSGTEESLAIAMGESQSVEAMTTSVVELATATQGKTLVDIVKTFTVEAEGYYHFGFHALSEAAKSGNLKLTNFAIADPSERVDPPAAGTVAVQVAPKGELKASVTYSAPTTTLTGASLAAIDSVQVSVNYSKVLTITSVNPGDVKVIDVPVKNTYNVVEAVAFVKDTPGATAKSAMFFAGNDNPLPPANLKAVLSDDFKQVVLSWDAVSEVGENGGYVDVESVTYYVFDAFGSVFDPAIAETSATSVTLDYSALATQDFAAYQVTAGTAEYYYSEAAESNIVVVGPPDALPFAESFANRATSKPWALDPENGYNDFLCQFVGDNELELAGDDDSAATQYLNSHDADNGFFLIMPVEANASFGFCSVKADVSAAANPVLEFFYQGMGSVIDVMVAAGSSPFEVVKTIDLKETPTSGWTLCRTDLAAYKQAPYVRFELRVRSVHNTAETTWSVPIDNIRIRDLVDSDLRLAALSAPAKVAAGNMIQLSASVENLGTAAAAGAVLEVADANGMVSTAQLPEIAPLSVVIAKVYVPTNAASPESYPLTATVKWDADREAANDAASTVATVTFSEYPAPVDVTATSAAGEVSLSWAAPSLDGLTDSYARVEDFEDESYEPLTICDFGGWTLFDGDGMKTYTFLSDANNPYRTQPMAFQLFDPVLAGVPSGYLPDCQPHSGSRLLMGFSCNSLNDNWLISPELSGAEQVVKFFGRSFSSAFPEEFEVLYSTSGTGIESMVAVESVTNYPANGIVPEEWTEFSFTLPAGAKHFAIHHTASDSYALMLDDFSFEAAGLLPADTELLGYNIFRNGARVNTEPVTSLTATDVPTMSGTYAYQVSAVYSNGESRASSPIMVDFDAQTGVSSPASTTAKIAGGKGEIIISGANGATVTVTATSGCTLFSNTVAADARISLPAGIYIVKLHGAAIKVLVR